MIVACSLLGFGIGTVCLAGNVYLRGTDDFITPIFNGAQPYVANIVGWAFLSWSCCILLAAFVCRHLLQWTAACLAATAGQLRDASLSFPIALVAACVSAGQACAGLVCVWLLEAALSITQIQWPAEMPSASALPEEGGSSRALPPTEIDAEIVPGGPLVRGLLRQPLFQLDPLMCICIP